MRFLPGKSRGYRYGLIAVLLAAPASAWIVLLTGSSLGLMMVHSLFGTTGISLGPFSLDNYLTAWSSSTYGPLYLRTLGLSIVVTLICLVIAIPVAFHLSVRSSRASFWLAVLLLPYLVGLIPRILALRVALGAEGVAGSLLETIGLSSDMARPLLFTNVGTALGTIYTELPVMIIFIYLSMERIDRRLLDAAMDLGAGSWHMLRTVILPNARIGIGAACVLVMATVFGAYAEPALLGGANGQLAANVIASRFQIFLDWGRGSALALTALAVISVFGLLIAGLLSIAGRRRDAGS